MNISLTTTLQGDSVLSTIFERVGSLLLESLPLEFSRMAFKKWVFCIIRSLASGIYLHSNICHRLAIFLELLRRVTRILIFFSFEGVTKGIRRSSRGSSKSVTLRTSVLFRVSRNSWCVLLGIISITETCLLSERLQEVLFPSQLKNFPGSVYWWLVAHCISHGRA